METTVRKAELLEILEANRNKHRGVFEAAIEGYREKAIEILNAKIDDLKAGRTPEIRLVVVRPEDHTADYDRIIKMVSMEVSENITLSERLFGQYVMDQWDWKDTFLRFSNRYASASTQKAYGVEVPDDDD